MGKSVDSGGSESAYLQGANEMAKAAQLGALFFAQDAASANRIIGDQSLKAQQSLQPLTGTATVAITELRRLMGLQPEDPLLGVGNALQAQAQHYESRGDIPVAYRTQVTSLAAAYNKMHDAGTLDERTAYKQELLNKLDKSIKTFSGFVPVDSSWAGSGRASPGAGDVVAGGSTGSMYDKGYFTSTVGTLTNARDQLSKMDMSEDAVHPKAMTGDQIAQEMMAKPSYQFMFQSGTKAAERGAAAAGTRFSGNQLQSLQQLGQNLAGQEYNNEITRLMGLAGMTTPGITQTSGTQFNQGQLQGNNWMQVAQANQLAKNLEGQGYMQAYNKIGDARMQSQIANQQAGMQAMQMGMGLLGKLF